MVAIARFFVDRRPLPEGAGRGSVLPLPNASPVAFCFALVFGARPLCTSERKNAPITRRIFSFALYFVLFFGGGGGVQLLLFRLVAGLAQQRVGRLLARFDAGLVECVDVEHRAGVRRLQFEQVHQLAEGEFVHFGQVDRVVLPPGLGEGVGRGLVFGLDELVHGVPAEEGHVGDIFTAVRNGHDLAVIFHGKEGDDLVEGALGIKLHLRVLVGHAQRFDGRLPHVAGLAVEGDVFAQALRPELAVPVGHEFEAVGIRHHNADVFAALHRHDLQNGAGERGVFGDGRLTANAVHIRGAREHRLDVQPQHCRGQQAHRAQLGEAAADAVGDVEGLVAVLLGEFDQVPLGVVGGGDDVFARLVSQRLFEDVVDDEVLRHRLAGRARLGDDVEARLFRLDDVEQRGHALGVDVVFDVELRALALGGREVVVMQVAEGVEHGDGAERAAADAQNDEVAELAAHFLGGGDDVFDDLFLVVRQLRPAHHALAAVVGDVVERVGRGFLHLRQLRILEAVAADELFHHIVVVDGDAHGIAPVFVSEIHTDPSISLTIFVLCTLSLL